MGEFTYQRLVLIKKTVGRSGHRFQFSEAGRDRHHHNGFILNRYHQIPLPKGVVNDGILVDPQALTRKIKELFSLSGSKRRNVVTSLSGNSVISQKVTFLKMPPDELRLLIHDEAGKYLPFDSMEDVSYDFQILGENEFNPTQMDVMLVAAKTEIVDSYADAIKSAGLNAVIVDVDSFALETMYEENYDFEGDQIAVLVNIGASMTNINVLKNGGSVLTRDFTLGGNNITEALQTKHGADRALTKPNVSKSTGPEGDEDAQERYPRQPPFGGRTDLCGNRKVG